MPDDIRNGPAEITFYDRNGNYFVRLKALRYALGAMLRQAQHEWKHLVISTHHRSA